MSDAKNSRAPGASSDESNTAEEIYERIYIAVLEHRLLPGTKLGEGRLATIFGSTRARVREALAHLAHEKIVELVPQHGAFIAKPTAEQAMDVFEARRLIEPAVLRRLVNTLTPEKIARLRSHQEREVDARQRDDKPTFLRLTGKFHQLVAELSGNSALARSMRELSTLTCLIISLYDAPTATSCRPDEHSEIIDAIEHRDAERAARLMLEHLDHIERSLRLDHSIIATDLEEIFSS